MPPRPSSRKHTEVVGTVNASAPMTPRPSRDYLADLRKQIDHLTGLSLGMLSYHMSVGGTAEDVPKLTITVELAMDPIRFSPIADTFPRQFTSPKRSQAAQEAFGG